VSVYYSDDQIMLHHGDALDVARQLPDGAADCIVTSPPYFGLRDFGVDGQYGIESSPAEFVEHLRVLFAELRRVLADDGTLWLNLGDSYSGGNRRSYDVNGGKTRARGHCESRPGADVPGKNLLGMPWRTAFALQDDGWILRNAIIWHKPNAMPESILDRLANRYEHLFLYSKSARYWFDLDPIREPRSKATLERYKYAYQDKGATYQNQLKKGTSRDGGMVNIVSDGRNPGDVWAINTQPFPAAHFATFPITLPTRCILAGCKPGGTVLDPFSGCGTTGLAAQRTGRRYIGIDLNAEYLDLSLKTRLTQSALDFEEPA
jgi:DNA modification methylase